MIGVVRDRGPIDSELRLVAALRRAARERSGPLPSIGVADALLDERRELTGLPRLTVTRLPAHWARDHADSRLGTTASGASRDGRSATANWARR